MFDLSAAAMLVRLGKENRAQAFCERLAYYRESDLSGAEAWRRAVAEFQPGPAEPSLVEPERPIEPAQHALNVLLADVRVQAEKQAKKPKRRASKRHKST